MAVTAKGKTTKGSKTAKKSAKKKAATGAASRRATATADKVSSKKKKTLGKKKAPKAEVAPTESAVVAEVSHALSKLSASEMKYYQEISELRKRLRSSEIMISYEIGEKLLECKRKHPKSGADVVIEAACDITRQWGRLYRKLAERFDRKTLEKIVEMKNSTTGWTIPISTLFSIMQRTPAAKKQMEFAQLIVSEQMSQTTFEERFPMAAEGDGGSATTVQAITATAATKKLQNVIAKSWEAVHATLASKSLMKELTSKGFLAESMSDVQTLIQQIRRNIQEEQAILARLEESMENHGLGDDGDEFEYEE